eukprot:scpid106050/ scgid34860/ 
MMGDGIPFLLHSTLWLVLLITVANGTHFRGGFVSCGPADPKTRGGFDSRGNVKLRCDYRVAWRRTYNDDTKCDEVKRNTGVVLAGAGDLSCRTGCSGLFGRLTIACTEFSIPENWSQGGGTF